jgi:hypothetical protein
MPFYTSLEMNTSLPCAIPMLTSTVDVVSSALILAARLLQPQTRQLHPTSARRALRDSEQPSPAGAVGEGRRVGM